MGTGRFAGPLGIKVAVEPALAEIAKTRRITVIQGDAEALPFVDVSFDCVLMITVLCFLQNPFQALCEATRVLRARGRLIIGMIDPDSPLCKHYEENKQRASFTAKRNFPWLARSRVGSKI